MLIETSTRFLVDSATIRSRGGFLTFYDATPEDLLRPRWSNTPRNCWA